MKETQHDRILNLLSGGRVATRAELGRSGFSQAVIHRMLDAGVLERTGTSGLRIAGWAEEDPWGSMAARWGHTGVICFHSAARLHGLTDLTPDQFPVRAADDGAGPSGKHFVALPPGYSWRTGNLIEIVRWPEGPLFATGVRWEQFGQYRMRVTDPARTVCDMFSSRCPVSENGQYEALGRLLDSDGDDGAALVTRYASALGLDGQVEAAVAAAKAARTWTTRNLHP
jgi:hypothetical protein